MNATIRVRHRLLAAAPWRMAGCCALFLVLLGACQKMAPSVDAHTAATSAKGSAAEGKEEPGAGTENTAGKDAANEGVALKPEEVEKLGIVTTELQPVMHTPETPGFGTVLAHEPIATALAELTTAAATEHQSRSAFTRGQKLAGTPGAMPADTQETAERQAIVDQAALDLAKRRLSATFGQNPPWKNVDSSPELTALASGETKLVRVTFPLGSVPDGKPASLRLAHINSSPGGKSWESRSVWSAPADTNVPGRSFFALLKGSDVGEGERILAWLPMGEPESGVQIPAAGALINGGKYWCYVEERRGIFVRTEIDTSMPTADGYFMKEGISVGDKVVIGAAGQLLAREINPSKEAD